MPQRCSGRSHCTLRPRGGRGKREGHTLAKGEVEAVGAGSDRPSRRSARARTASQPTPGAVGSPAGRTSPDTDGARVSSTPFASSRSLLVRRRGCYYVHLGGKYVQVRRDSPQATGRASSLSGAPWRRAGSGRIRATTKKFSSMSKRLAIDLPEGTPSRLPAELRQNRARLLTCSSFVGRVVVGHARGAARHQEGEREGEDRVCGTFRRSRPRPRPRCIAHASPNPSPLVVRGSGPPQQALPLYCTPQKMPQRNFNFKFQVF